MSPLALPQLGLHALVPPVSSIAWSSQHMCWAGICSLAAVIASCRQIIQSVSSNHLVQDVVWTLLFVLQALESTVEEQGISVKEAKAEAAKANTDKRKTEKVLLVSVHHTLSCCTTLHYPLIAHWYRPSLWHRSIALLPCRLLLSAQNCLLYGR